MPRFSLNKKNTKDNNNTKLQRINTTFYKIKSTILSCDHFKQLPTVRRMIGIYKYQINLNFDSVFDGKELVVCFHDYRSLCEMFKEKENQLKNL